MRERSPSSILRLPDPDREYRGTLIFWLEWRYAQPERRTRWPAELAHSGRASVSCRGCRQRGENTWNDLQKIPSVPYGRSGVSVGHCQKLFARLWQPIAGVSSFTSDRVGGVNEAGPGRVYRGHGTAHAPGSRCTSESNPLRRCKLWTR